VADPHDDVGSTQPGHYGAAAAGVVLAEVSVAAAWNVQGDPSHASFTDAVQRQFGLALPLAPGGTTRTGALTALWLGPTSWLLIAGNASPSNEFTAMRDALNDAGGALFDVSASRVGWTLSGPRAADVLAKGCPLDVHPRAFPVGACAQSVYGHINVLIARHREAPAFTLLVARSFARDMWHSLCVASAPYGFDVTAPAAFR